TPTSEESISMFGYDWPRFHAAVNDLPAALLFVTVLFDFAGWFTKRESLKAAALWTLWAGVIGGWIAVIAGLQAEDAIEHGEAIHELLETHETLALTTMGIFTVVLGWKLCRRARLTPPPEAGLRVPHRGGPGDGARLLTLPFRTPHSTLHMLLLLIAACTPVTTRPDFKPDTRALVVMLNARPERVTVALDSLLPADSLEVARFNVRDGYVES